MPLNPRRPNLEPITGSVELVIDKAGRVRQAGSDRAGQFITDIKTRAERDLYFFAKVIMGYDLLTPALHLPECRRLQATPPYRKLTLFPRGHFKTTILKALNLHIVIQPGTPNGDGTFENVYFPNGIIGATSPVGTDTRILLASKTAGLAQSTLAELMMTIEASEYLSAFWPHCFWENTKDARWWNQERIVLPRTATHKEATIETVGVGGQITGYHFNVHIFDDLIDIESANSPTIMFKTIEWWKASRALMHDRERSLEYIVGTRWAVSDLYDWIIKNDPSVQPHVRAVIEDGQPILPELFTLDLIAQMQREDPVMFPLLYMNSATDRSLTDFDMEKVRSFIFSDGKLCFEESAADGAVAARHSFAASHDADIAARREQKRASGRKLTFDELTKHREEYLSTRYIKPT